ncbi:MAG: amino acid ABC transporter permease, partial [Chloroflexota bacterium]
MTEMAAGPPPPGSQAGLRPEAIKAIPVRHPWRWVSTVVVVALVAEIVYIFVTAPNMNWAVVWQYLF